MSFKLKFKIFLFKFLEILPKNQGYWFYHKIQNIFSREDLQSKIWSSSNTYRTFEELARQNEIEIEDKVILEIGSGWLPLMPYFFIFIGKAGKVETFDLNRHYHKRNIEKLNEVFARIYNVEINKDTESNFSLPVNINYHPYTNILNKKLISCDVVFSRFVLEHVDPKDIEAMHLKFKNELRPGSYIIHLISPSDHRAYIDKNLSLQDFLKYSEKEWNNKQTRFDYHNRLRLPEYLEIFKSLDLEIVHLTYEVPDKNSEYYRRFKALNLHQNFKGYTDEDLMAGAINIILKV